MAGFVGDFVQIGTYGGFCLAVSVANFGKGISGMVVSVWRFLLRTFYICEVRGKLG